MQQTSQAPIQAIDNGNGVLLNITEAQLNAAVERLFDEKPLDRYIDAPQVRLGDGALVMTLHIVPQNAPADSGAQTLTLIATLAIYDGMLEMQPSALAPLDVGVTTRQAKLAHNLLMRSLAELVTNTAGTDKVTYNFASITPDKVLLTVVRN